MHLVFGKLFNAVGGKTASGPSIREGTTSIMVGSSQMDGPNAALNNFSLSLYLVRKHKLNIMRMTSNIAWKNTK